MFNRVFKAGLVSMASVSLALAPIAGANATEKLPTAPTGQVAAGIAFGVSQPAAGAVSKTTINSDMVSPGVINTWKSWDNKTKVLGTYLNVSKYTGKSIYVKSIKQCFTGLKGERIYSRPVLTSETTKYLKDISPAESIFSGQCHTWPVKKTFYKKSGKAILVSTAKMYEQGPKSVVAGFYLK